MATGPRSEGYFNILDFDENDASLLRFKMDPNVRDAIERCLHNINESENYGLSYWEPVISADNRDAQTIEYFKEIFRDCQVLPYIYYIKDHYQATRSHLMNGVGDHYSNQPFYVPSTGVLSNAHNSGEFNSTAPVDSEATGIYENDNIAPFSSFDVNGVASVSSYFTGAMSNINILSNEALAKITDFSNLVVKPYVITIDDMLPDGALLQYTRMREYTAPYTPPAAFRPDDVYEWADFKEKFGSKKVVKFLETRDNSNNGEYDADHPRALAGSATGMDENGNTMQFFGTSQYSEQDPKGINPFVFVVKTQMPWYKFDNDTQTIIRDTSKDGVPQYFFFNVMSLLTQRSWFNQFCFAMGGPKDALTDVPSVGSNRTEYIDRNFVGLSFWGQNRVGSACPVTYYPPFAWYIRQTASVDYMGRATDEDDERCILFGSKSTFNPSSLHNGTLDWENLISTQNASTVGFAKDSNIQKFLYYGLGLPATLDEDEFEYKPVEDWELPPPAVGFVPGSGGQEGGEQAGGSQTGAYEFYDDIGPYYTSTNYSFLEGSYLLNQTNVIALQRAILSPSIWESIFEFAGKAQDGVISLVRFPIRFDDFDTFSSVDIELVGVELDGSDGNPRVEGYRMPERMKNVFDIGYFDFKENFGTYLDYDDTSIEMYLPFIGFKNINTDSVMKRRVHIQYVLNYEDGSCKVILRASNNRAVNDYFGDIESGGSHPIYMFDGQIGEIVNLSTSTKDDKYRNLFKSVVSGFGNVAKSPSPLVAAGESLVNIGMTAMEKVRYQANGNMSGNETYAINNLMPFCIINFVETNIPDGFQEFNGYITNMFDEMQNFEGYTQFDDVKISGTSATLDELNELKTLLEGGIVIL